MIHCANKKEELSLYPVKIISLTSHPDASRSCYIPIYGRTNNIIAVYELRSCITVDCSKITSNFFPTVLQVISLNSLFSFVFSAKRKNEDTVKERRREKNIQLIAAIRKLLALDTGFEASTVACILRAV